MSTFAAKLAGGLARGSGQPSGQPKPRPGAQANPARQTVGFSVSNNVDRLGFIGNVLIGYKVEVQVKCGLVYEGVFSALVTDPAGASVVLKFAKVVKDPNADASDRNRLAERPVAVITIAAGDLVQVYAKDVRMSPEDLAGTDRSDFGFETDAAISRGRGGGERELQRWQPDEADNSAFFSLEGAASRAEGSSRNANTTWDQFAVNRDRFGVRTTWNEHFYTTKINRDECRISDAEAERIAKEIEKNLGAGGAAATIHMLEERGGELAADVDEEALYGAVIREQPPHSIPHHQQRPQQQRPRPSHQSAADRAVAWGRAGSGVAAVAGGLAPPLQATSALPQGQQAQPGAGGKPTSALGRVPPSVPIPVPSPAASTSGGGAAADGAAGGSVTSTAPIDIDARKEVNKVRSSLTVGPKKDRSSPYGTPKLHGMSRSPVFASPLVADPLSFTALNLDPGAPQNKLDPDAHAEFLRFKEKIAKERSAQMGAGDTLSEFRRASTSFKDRAAAAPAGAAGAAASAQDATPAAAAPAASSDGGAVVAAAQPTAEPAATPAAAAAAPAALGQPAAAAPAAVSAAADAAAKPAANGEEPKAKPVSKLNPNAKPFSLNIFAKEFVPTFGPKPAAAAAAAAPAVAAAAAPAAAPAASSNAANGTAVTAATPAAAAAQAVPSAAAAGGQGGQYTASGGNSHGLATTYHHSSTGHSQHGVIHSHQGQGQYGHAAGGQGHGHGHGHGGGPHHERGYGAGAGASGPMGREMREHGNVYHRSSDSYRGGEGNGPNGTGAFRGGGGGGEMYRGGNSGDGYHHHHKAGAGGHGEHHAGKGSDSQHGGLHKVPPPPPPQGPMSAEGPMGTMIMNGVGPGGMAPHGMVPMTQAMAAGMPTMGAVPYGVVMAPPGGFMTSAMPGAVMASTAGGVPIMYAVRPAGGGHTMMAGGMAMMGGPGMSAPYGAAVGPYMTGPPGSMPPPSPTTGRPATGFFQPTGGYPMIAAAHPGAHGHPHGHGGGPMGPGGHMGGGHMMVHGHGHHGHMQHMQQQDGRGGGMGPKGAGRQGRPPRVDHERAGSRDME